MKEIKSIIATTLPDQMNAKLTKNVLKKFSGQINGTVPKLPVRDGNGKKIGQVNSSYVTKGNLSVIMEVDPDLVDKQWEYFFIPDGEATKKEEQGRFAVTLEANFKGVKMVKFPHDLTLKPYRFDQKYKENVDYFIKRHTDITPEVVAEIFTGKPIYIYYPQEMGTDAIIFDAKEKGFIEDLEDKEGGQQVFPFQVCVWPEDFEHFRIHIIEQWTKLNTGGQDNPLTSMETGKFLS